MRQQLRWECDSTGIQHGHIVPADAPDSTGPCPLCRLRHRVNLVGTTNMNKTCYTLSLRLRERAKR